MTTLLSQFQSGSDSEEESRTLVLAFEGEESVLDEPAADAELCAIVPPPATHSSFADLQETSRLHRVLILRRGAVIAVSTLVAIGGALLFHFLFAGAFVAAAFWGRQSAGQGVGGGDSPDEGGRGYMLVEDAPAAAGAGSADQAAEALPPSPVSVPPAALPALPEPVALPPVTAAALPSVTPPIVIPEDLGSVKAPPPPPVAPPPQVVVVPPTPQAAPTPAPAGGPSKPAVASAVGNGKGQAPGGDEFGDETEIAMFKPGKGSGRGEGRGTGAGNGIDRGISAANRGAQPLDVPAFNPPMHLQARMPKKSARFSIHVEADGSISAIDLEQSCGVTEMDDYLRSLLLSQLHFRPRVRDGKPVSSVETFEYSFGGG